ncbi:hypothetical protein AC578_11125 [Pseudocercospora eumusae]|uniref:Uncharacterized protein n=1 Tax=Pseudocercospora eumusae TaxID=321146 RepID=A0A139H2E4_9PEZI|nr:hypothetical protein AC578_11125 [Pseudocercospora eumusae]
MPTKRKAPTSDVLTHTKRRACQAHGIKHHECDVADDSSDSSSSDGDAAPVLPQEPSDHAEAQIRKCLALFNTFPSAADITIQELLKCWIQYALCQTGHDVLDFSTWLHTQDTALEGDTSGLDRLLKLSPPAAMLQTMCDKLGKCLETAAPTSSRVQARAQPSQTLEAATAAFDPVRYRSLDKSERVQMARRHFPNAQKLFQYHATVNNAINIKVASHDLQSPEHLFHETWSRLGAELRAEWEQLLLRLHKDGLKKPVGPAGQQLLQQHRTIEIVAAVMASSATCVQAPSAVEAFANQPDSRHAVPRQVNQDRTATGGLECVWSFDEKHYRYLTQEERSISAKAHFPTSLHLLAYHIREHEATTCLIDWQDSDQVSHRVSRVWQALPGRIQKSWEARLSDLHKGRAKKAFRKKLRRTLELDIIIKPILIKLVSPEQSIPDSDAPLKG